MQGFFYFEDIFWGRAINLYEAFLATLVSQFLFHGSIYAKYSIPRVSHRHQAKIQYYKLEDSVQVFKNLILSFLSCVIIPVLT